MLKPENTTVQPKTELVEFAFYQSINQSINQSKKFIVHRTGA